MSELTIDVSVLIPVLNEEPDLREVAAAMLAQRFDGTVEFLFIDGGSTDASPQILAELAALDPRVRVLANPARRTPHALNIGLSAARGEFVARMDAHAVYPERYLAVGVERLRAGGFEWISGPALATGSNRGSARVARAVSTPFGRGGAAFREELTQEREVDTGFAGVWRRELLVRYGGWDEDWVNDQDLELAARIRHDGGRILCVPEMAAQYVPRATLPALARQYGTYGIYRVKTARRHPGTLRRSQLLAPGVVVAAAGAVLAPGSHLRTASRAGVTAYLAGLAVSGVRAARDERRPSDALVLPAVWATMHLSYGVGFLRGCRHFGVPSAAIWSLARGAAP